MRTSSLIGWRRAVSRRPLRLLWLRPTSPPSLASLARRFSTFEKVVIANSVVIILDTLAGWWITQHDPETYHYLIDTSFIALAGVLGLAINFVLLRAAFAPLQGMLATIRAIARGDVGARAMVPPHDADARVLADAFNAMLDELAGMRDESAASVLRAQEVERRQVALELHDQTGQNLTALTLHAQAIAQQLSGISGATAERARAQVERLQTLIQQTLVDVQVLSRQLRPPLLDDWGLEAALRWLAHDGGERLGIQVQVRVRGFGGELRAGERLSDEVETTLFRIAQESLTNAVRHGQARQVWMILRKRADAIVLTIIDDGVGFAAGKPSSEILSLEGAMYYGAYHGEQRQGLGLEGMRERTRLLRGRFRVRSKPGAGCVVRAVVPVRVPQVSRAVVPQTTGRYSSAGARS